MMYSYEKPYWYRKWRIYLYNLALTSGYEYAYVHDDFDVDDDRYGYAHSIDEAKADIDDYEENNS